MQFFKRSVDQYESDLLSVVQSLLLSMGKTDLQLVKTGLCNGSCIRYALVKLLRSSGYDAAVCSSKWQGCNKVPGGINHFFEPYTILCAGDIYLLAVIQCILKQLWPIYISPNYLSYFGSSSV